MIKKTLTAMFFCAAISFGQRNYGFGPDDSYDYYDRYNHIVASDLNVAPDTQYHIDYKNPNNSYETVNGVVVPLDQSTRRVFELMSVTQSCYSAHSLTSDSAKQTTDTIIGFQKNSSSANGKAAVIFIASNPPVADVYMDGKLIGYTNTMKLNVQAGSHSMRFIKGTQEVTKDMTFKPGDNSSAYVLLK